jgi:hypothetical protein
LPPLVFSCLSFSHFRSLFSAACSLFWQKQGGGVDHDKTTPLAAHDPASPALMVSLEESKNSIVTNETLD